MTQSLVWVGLAAALAILELFSGTFYLLMIALGAAAGALAAWLAFAIAWQFLIAGGVGIAATVLLRRSRFGKSLHAASSSAPASLDIGQRIDIDVWDIDGHGAAHARSRYRGALWDIDYVGEGMPGAGNFRIVAIVGSRLRVSV
ncbi:MAG: NfeD family protein [Pseudomonadota bacterium]|nr:NfeD family protein [Pseudomonadota bacterium]